ncbi:MAG TPA: hypothetical protein VM165_19090 [Planctomycetaceae bacterium]|nr:hypothetical protein [Planctomycetaceae bacterium]
MVTAIALLGSLITVTATTLHQVLRTETVARRGNDRLTAVSRAATAFRADVHAATEITLADEGRHLTCRFADQSVVDYVVEPTALRRTYQPPGNAAPQREAYVLHDATVSFRSEERSGRTVYTMLWQLPPAGVVSAATTVPVTPVPIPIEAVPRRSPAGS